MRVVYGFWATMVTALVIHVQLSSSKRDKAVYCSVCRALVDEINVRISEADPKKKVQVGSFRVDPNGNQRVSEVKYATSDLHLTEILEVVCESFNDYALIHDHITKRDGVVRTKDRSGKELDASNARFSAKLRETFKSYCEEVIEETEDDIMKIFKQEDRESIEGQLCGELSGACTEEELLEPVPYLKEKRPPRKLPFHVLEPTDGSSDPYDPEKVETMDDMKELRNRILSAATKGNQPNDDEEDDLKDEL